MPRNISPEFKVWLGSELLTLATCVLVTRRDAVKIGMTSLDQMFTFEGVLYEPEGSMETTSVSSSASSGVDNMEMAGVLDSDRISETDLKAGKYDYADILVFQVNYANLGFGKMILLRAKLGEVTFSDDQFRCELRSLSAQLKQYVGEMTSPTCRVQRLGDARCKVDLTPFTHTFDVVSQDTSDWRVITMDDLTSIDNEYFTFGVARAVGGDNDGVEKEIRRNEGNILRLRESFPYALSAGDTLVLEAGCDRRFITCGEKFDNVVNFRGEPHLPGNMQLVKTGRPPS